jgi:hypothetical protein
MTHQPTPEQQAIADATDATNIATYWIKRGNATLAREWLLTARQLRQEITR